MIVKCISESPTESQSLWLGPGFSRNHASGVVLGRQYFVLGLLINVSSQSMGKGAWVEILMEPDIPTVISAPLFLFDVEDARVSRYWEVSVSEGVIALEHPSFRGSLLEDVSNRFARAEDEFWMIVRLIREEAGFSTMGRRST